MDSDLLARIVASDPARDRIEHMVVAHLPGRGWTFRISYAGMSRVHPSDLASRQPVGRSHQVVVNEDLVPEGVTVRAYERDPDALHPLPDPGPDVRAGVHRWIGRLAEHMGRLEVERHDPASVDALAHDPWPRWHLWPAGE